MGALDKFMVVILLFYICGLLCLVAVSALT